MTVKEIATRAGVSPAAVSRYLNGGSLSAEKAERIKAVIEETGFRPNQAAQTLRTGSVKQIGVIVPKINSSSVGEVVAGINEVIIPKGYAMLLGSTDQDGSKELQYMDLMQSNRVAGVILMGTTMTPMKRDTILQTNLPVVVTGQNFEAFPCVYHDDYGAMKSLTEKLISKGRKTFAYIGVDDSDLAVGQARRQGVLDALKEAELDGAATWYVAQDWEIASGYDIAAGLLLGGARPDAIICATDKLAHGALMALKEQKLKVPREVSLAGVGNDWADEVVAPTMSTVRLYHKECGRDAANILMQMIEEPDSEAPKRQIKMGFSIVERESI